MDEPSGKGFKLTGTASGGFGGGHPTGGFAHHSGRFGGAHPTGSPDAFFGKGFAKASGGFPYASGAAHPTHHKHHPHGTGAGIAKPTGNFKDGSFKV